MLFLLYFLFTEKKIFFLLPHAYKKFLYHIVAAAQVQCTNPIIYNDCGSLLGGYLVRAAFLSPPFS